MAVRSSAPAQGLRPAFSWDDSAVCLYPSPYFLFGIHPPAGTVAARSTAPPQRPAAAVAAAGMPGGTVGAPVDEAEPEGRLGREGGRCRRRGRGQEVGL